MKRNIFFALFFFFCYVLCHVNYLYVLGEREGRVSHCCGRAKVQVKSWKLIVVVIVIELIPIQGKKSLLDTLMNSNNDSNNYNDQEHEEGEMLRKEVQMCFGEQSLMTDKSLSSLQWWKDNEENFSKLALLAKSSLAVPTTSTPSEHLFSAAGNIVRKKRKPDSIWKGKAEGCSRTNNFRQQIGPQHLTAKLFVTSGRLHLLRHRSSLVCDGNYWIRNEESLTDKSTHCYHLHTPAWRECDCQTVSFRNLQKERKIKNTSLMLQNVEVGKELI